MSETLEIFHKNLLKIEHRWKVQAIRRDSRQREVTIIVGYAENEPYKVSIVREEMLAVRSMGLSKLL